MDDQGRYRDPSEIRHVIGPNGQLTINNVSGTVELRAADGDEVVVNARSEGRGSDWLPLTVRKLDGALEIDVDKRGPFNMFGSFFGGNDGVEFEVSVPRGARVSVNAVSADINAHFLSGEQSYKTVSGDVEIDPDGGRVAVTTVSGDIEVRAGEPLELTLNSTSGDISVEGATLSVFHAKTVSGDVEFEAGLAAGPVHSVETVSGDLSVESTTGVTVDYKSGMDMRRGGETAYVAGDGAASLRFRTLSGDCHVEGARRENRRDGGDRSSRFERRIERHAERLAERMTDQFGFGPGRGGRRGSEAPTAPPPVPPRPPMAPPAPPAVDQLEVLRALERGEIDVEEAARRLQEG